MRIGVALPSEEFGPGDLVDLAIRAERAGFAGLWISDHFHPWNDEQGHSPFVWSVIGAIAQATDLPLGTGVTCPTVRIHPAIVAQAAATSSLLLGGRFTFGVGSGEALNEHILGDRWPGADERLEMLEEAVEVIRKLRTGKVIDHDGLHCTVQSARIYDAPDTPPPVLVSGFGPEAVRLAARIGEGFVPPAHFEQAAGIVPEEAMESMPLGPDLDRHYEGLKEYADAGVDELFVQQIGPEQDGFFETWAQEILPRFHDETR